jgi:hypothetical protein
MAVLIEYVINPFTEPCSKNVTQCLFVRVEKFDWLIIDCFTSRSRICHRYGNVITASEGLQNLGLCSALRTFEQGGILYHATPAVTQGNGFSGPAHLHLLRHTRDVEDLFSPGSSPVPIQSPLATRKKMLKTYSYPYPHGSICNWTHDIDI